MSMILFLDIELHTINAILAPKFDSKQYDFTPPATVS